MGTTLDSVDIAGNRKGHPNYPKEFKRQVAMAACEPGIRLQRREHYRMATPIVNPVCLTIPLPAKAGDDRALFPLADISCGGVATLVAQHLMRATGAARLMGADCIISGIRPQIAQTIVHLGVSMEEVVTKATLADAFMVALDRVGESVMNT